MTSGLYDAYYLPRGVAADGESTVQRFGPPHDAIELRLPVVTSAAIAYWARSIAAARREYLLCRLQPPRVFLEEAIRARSVYV